MSKIENVSSSIVSLSLVVDGLVTVSEAFNQPGGAVNNSYLTIYGFSGSDPVLEGDPTVPVELVCCITKFFDAARS